MMEEDLMLFKKAASLGEGYYLPPFKEIAVSIGLANNHLPDGEVTVSSKLLRFLLQGWLVNQHFEDSAYRAANPDVDAAIEAKQLESAWSHYVTTGYYEGRSPGSFYVDPKFYRRSYPDVALAERKGLTTVADHYAKTGRDEGRAPSQAHRRFMQLWNEALM